MFCLFNGRFYVTLIDDYIRNVWVYFLKNKYKVVGTFKKCRVAMEKETDIKCLKSNNGGEYKNKEFVDYYVEQGIGMLKTVSEMP